MASTARAVWDVLDCTVTLPVLTAGWDVRSRVRLSLVNVDTRATLAPAIMDLQFAISDIAQIAIMEDKKRRADLWCRTRESREREHLAGYTPLHDPEAWPTCSVVYGGDAFPTCMRDDVIMALDAWTAHCTWHRPEVVFDVQVFEAYDAGVLAGADLCDIVARVCMITAYCGGCSASLSFVDDPMSRGLYQLKHMPISDCTVLKASYSLMFATATGRRSLAVRGVVTDVDSAVDVSQIWCVKLQGVYLCGRDNVMIAYCPGPDVFDNADIGDVVPVVPPQARVERVHVYVRDAAASMRTDGIVTLRVPRGMICETQTHWWDAVKHMFMV